MSPRFKACILACVHSAFSLYISAEELNDSSCPSHIPTHPTEQSISYLENPEDLFSLALEHQNRDEFEQALKYYQLRMSLGGSDSELYKTMLRIGLVQDRLNMPSKDIEDSFEMAFSLQNTHAEPLYYLGLYYRSRGDYMASYRVLRVAVKIPCPAIEADKQLYEWPIVFAFSISAHLVGQLREAMAAYDALLANPKVPVEHRRSVSKTRAIALSQMTDPRFTVQPIYY